MKSNITKLALSVSLLPIVAMAQMSSSVTKAEKIEANISFVGDDQLTQTLVVSLEKSLVSTGQYELVSEGKQRLQLIVPGPVYWKDVRGRMNFHYVVVMVGGGSKYLGTVTGACWFDEVSSCAKAIALDIEKSGALDGIRR